MKGRFSSINIPKPQSPSKISEESARNEELQQKVNNLTKILAGSLMHVETNQLAMAVCSKRYKTLACDRGLVRALLSNGQNSKTATYILMAGCERQDIAATLADLGNLWIHLKLPSFRMTAKLLMRVLIPSVSSVMVLEE